MIRHIVLLRLRADTSEETRAELMRDLAACVEALPGCGRFRALENTTVEAPMVKGYRHAFSVDFDDAAARDRYLEDPTHRAIGARLVAASEGGVDGIVVFDHALDAGDA